MKKKLNFEEGMDELQAIVSSLEGGELSLDDSFSAYEKGVSLAHELKKILSDGDARIVALKSSLDGIHETDISGEVE